MSLLYLLDTNILSEPTRKSPDTKVLNKVKQHQYEIATAAPVFYELLIGTRRLPDSLKRKKLEVFLKEFVSIIPKLPYTDHAADWHATEATRLINKGQTPAYIDAQIAAIAISNNLIMVTHNIDDFQQFSGLEIEDWFEEN